jgi:anti-sigma factor ChrR (cupin superfamily)
MEVIMRQTLFRLCAAVGILLLPLGVLTATAQQSSPVAEEEAFELPPGVGLAVLAQLAAVELPETATLHVFRLTLEPGAEIPVHPHPGMEIGIVEEGSGAIHTVEGPPAQLIRADAAANASPEAYGAGEELKFAAGDVVVVPAGNMSDAWAGDQGATVLAFEFAVEETLTTPEA